MQMQDIVCRSVKSNGALITELLYEFSASAKLETETLQKIKST